MTDKRVVLTTCGSLEEARRIANALVEGQLAACVNVVPQIESIYRWEGKVQTDNEWLLVIKTTSAAFERLRKALTELHTYKLPECIALDIADGSVPYFDWIAASVK
jgi:periplasmic divalent cation tolerance protein